MHGTERRVHVYQNGTHTVAKLSETRLSSSSSPPPPPPQQHAPPLRQSDGLDISVSHPAFAEHHSSNLFRDCPLDVTDATTNSPFTFAAFRSASGWQRENEDEPEATTSSPPPRPPPVHPAAGNPPMPFEALTASPSPAAGAIGNSGIRVDGKSQLLSSSASAVGLHSLPGLSQSPQLTQHHFDQLQQRRQQQHSSDSGMTSNVGVAPWRANASIHINTYSTEHPGAVERCDDFEDANNNTTDGMGTAASPLLMSCDVSCITCSPAEPELTSGDNGTSQAPTQLATQHHEQPAGSEATAFPHASTSKVASRPRSRRSGEVSMAERVLFQDDDDDDGSSGSETGQQERTFRQSSGATSRGTRSGLQSSSVDTLLRSANQGSAAAFALGTFQAHTPPRSMAAEDTPEQRQSDGFGGKRQPCCTGNNSANVSGNATVNSTLSCTCAPEQAERQRRSRDNTLNASAAEDSTARQCMAANVPLSTLHSRVATTATTINDNNAVDADHSTLSATAPSFSSIAPSFLGAEERTADKRLPDTHGATVCAAEKADTPHSRTAGVEADRDELQQTPRGPTAKVLPSDVDSVAAATPTVGGCVYEHTPTPTPHRRELLRQLLTQAISATLHTPRAMTPSSAASSTTRGGAAVSVAAATTKGFVAELGSPQTPTPHPSRRLGSSSAGWEGLAQISGFPTPVKLSPIPTKAYAMYAEMAASTAAGNFNYMTEGTEAALQHQQQQPAVVVPGPPPDQLASPTVSAIGSDDGALPPAVDVVVPQPENAPSPPPPRNEAAAQQVTAAAPQAAESSTNNVAVCHGAPAETSVHDDSDHQTPFACPAHKSTNSECSVSPIRARAGQTTRVWTPHSSDVSQAHTLPPWSSLSCVAQSRDGAAPSLTAESPPPSMLPCDPNTLKSKVVKTKEEDVHAQEESDVERSRATQSTKSTANVEKRVQLVPLKEKLLPSAQPSSQVSRCTSFRRSALSPDLPVNDAVAPTASTHQSGDPCGTGRVSPRLIVDTLNLGTPTVSMIHSPAQAMNESCSFLLPPSSAPYIQALPIPGMRCHATPRISKSPLEQPARRGGKEASFRSVDSTADALWLRLNEVKHVAASRPRPPLLSPSLESDTVVAVGVRADTVTEASLAFSEKILNASRTNEAAAATARQRRSVPLLSPSIESETTAEEKNCVAEPSVAIRVSCGTQTSQLLDPFLAAQSSEPSIKELSERAEGSFASVKSSVHESALQKASVVQEPTQKVSVNKIAGCPFASSMESLPQGVSHSYTSTAASQRYQRFGLSSNTDGRFQSREESRTQEASYTARSRYVVAAKSVSSTRHIDSWL